MSNLKERIQADTEFFKHIYSKVPARKVLATVQKKYPEAIKYEALRQRIYLATKTDGFFRWIEPCGGEIKLRVVYVPRKEDDE